MKVCRIGRVYDWKSVKLEGCRIGMCDFMDCIGSIIFGIFIDYSYICCSNILDNCFIPKQKSIPHSLKLLGRIVQILCHHDWQYFAIMICDRLR